MIFDRFLDVKFPDYKKTLAYTTEKTGSIISVKLNPQLLLNLSLALGATNSTGIILKIRTNELDAIEVLVPGDENSTGLIMPMR